MPIKRQNQVWCADITYIQMAKGFVYLVAVMDWFSRRVLAWPLSIGMDTDFCVEALQEAMERFGHPKCSTPIKACSSPVLRFSTSWKAAVCAPAWTAKGGSSTTSSLRGCGAA
jgi:putative transposase